MIKQLVNLVMPKQMMFLGAAIGIVSTLYSIDQSRKQQKKQNEALDAQRRSSKIIRAEQAGRARRSKIRNSFVAQAQAEAAGLAGGNAPSSGSTNAVSEIQVSTAEDLGNLNTGLATGNIDAILKEQTANAGRPSNASLFNSAFVQPVANQLLSNSISNAFSTDPIAPGTPTP